MLASESIWKDRQTSFFSFSDNANAMVIGWIVVVCVKKRFLEDDTQVKQ